MPFSLETGSLPGRGIERLGYLPGQLLLDSLLRVLGRLASLCFNTICSMRSYRHGRFCLSTEMVLVLVIMLLVRGILLLCWILVVFRLHLV